MKNFAIIGVGGYIAPRHIQAINEIGGRVVCATDITDSVGILDRYTQNVAFFTEFERFYEYLSSLKGTSDQVDTISICSPNFLHISHIKFALAQGCNVVCEKPLVLNESQIDEINEYQKKYDKKVYTILQLRVHESILNLKSQIETNNSPDKHEIILTYLTSRGPWYHESWKGDTKKSGGLTTNIGIHFFDMLTWIFGDVIKNEIHKKNNLMASGYLELENANIKWFLSVDSSYLPEVALKKKLTTYRSITVDGNEIEFSGGFTELHNKIYELASSGVGYVPEENRTAVKIVEQIRNNKEVGIMDYSHEFLKSIL